MLVSVIIFIFTLLILVVLHEFGHFIMAKKFGIKVEEFGFGIPPRIFGKKIGETLYSLNWLPIGGFVKLQGEDEEGKVIGERDFRAKPAWQRIIVVVAGVVMNLLLAWIIFYGVIIYQNYKIIYPTLDQGVYIDFLEPNFPAQKDGVNLGDQILKVNNVEIKSSSNIEGMITEAHDLIAKNQKNPVTLDLKDLNGNQKHLTLTPQKLDGEYKIGVGFSPIPIKEYKTPIEKIFSGITYSLDLTKVTFLGFGKLFTDLGHRNFESASQSVAGPVGLAKTSNDILSSGPGAAGVYAWFVGVISLTLAIFNVLPIPALDGGRLLFLVIEAVFKKKIAENIEKNIHQVGFIILLGLALLVTFSDISKLFHK